MPNSNGSLVTRIKHKPKYRIRAVAKLFLTFYKFVTSRNFHSLSISITTPNLRNVYQLVPVSSPPQKFVRIPPLYWF